MKYSPDLMYADWVKLARRDPDRVLAILYFRLERDRFVLNTFLERASEIMETVKGGDGCGALWELVSDMCDEQVEREEELLSDASQN